MPGAGWRPDYLRFDLSVPFYELGSFSQKGLEDNGGRFLDQDIDTAPVFGTGIGWNLGSRVRFDLPAEYRTLSDLHGRDFLELNLVAPDGLVSASTRYTGDYSAIVGLANLYADLGTWNGFTPYIGGGIGIAHNRITGIDAISVGSFEDATTGAIRHQTTVSHADGKSENTFAWALMAGLSYDLSERSKLDIGYRYLNLGKDVAATSAFIECECGTVGDPLKVEDLEAHEIRIGYRWLLDEPSPAVHLK